MRLLPEYSPVKSILLALPYEGSDWDANLSVALKCYRDMVSAFLQNDSSINVLLLVKPASDWRAWYKAFVSSGDLSVQQLSRFIVIADIDYDDTWVRDYGPLSFLDSEIDNAISYKSFTFNGWGKKYLADADNAVAMQLVRYGIGPQMKHHLIVEGGGLEVNDDGVLLVNRDCIVDDNRNASLTEEVLVTELHRALGVHDIEWIQDVQLTGDDTDGHIDTLARFIDGHTLVCCGRNTQHHDAQSLENLNNQLSTICTQRSWSLIALPMPIVRSNVDNRLLPATYANFLICNQQLFLPTYGVAEDAAALEILIQSLPQFKIIPIRCEALLEQHGSLHCATMQLAGENR